MVDYDESVDSRVWEYMCGHQESSHYHRGAGYLHDPPDPPAELDQYDPVPLLGYDHAPDPIFVNELCPWCSRNQGHSAHIRAMRNSLTEEGCYNDVEPIPGDSDDEELEDIRQIPHAPGMEGEAEVNYDLHAMEAFGHSRIPDPEEGWRRGELPFLPDDDDNDSFVHEEDEVFGYGQHGRSVYY